MFLNEKKWSILPLIHKTEPHSSAVSLSLAQLTPGQHPNKRRSVWRRFDTDRTVYRRPPETDLLGQSGEHKRSQKHIYKLGQCSQRKQLGYEN